MSSRNAKKSFILFLKGLFMGMADIIPGVSGGTIALITGIYEELIFKISNIRPRLRSVDFKFFIPLLLGIGIAFLTLARVMNILLIDFTGPTYAFFFGLILASAIFVYRTVERFPIHNLFYVIIGFIFAFLIAGLPVLQATHTLPIIFGSGIIAIVAMILPGISGSFILLLLGQYEFMISVINELRFTEIGVFIIGALIGLLGFSHVLKRLLKRYEAQTMAFLIGLMLGALRLPFDKMAGTSTGTLQDIWIYLIPAIIGILIVPVVSYLAKKQRIV